MLVGAEVEAGSEGRTTFMEKLALEDFTSDTQRVGGLFKHGN